MKGEVVNYFRQEKWAQKTEGMSEWEIEQLTRRETEERPREWAWGESVWLAV